MTSFSRILLVAILVTPFLGSTAFAQRPLENLRRGWDEIRPRGRILREIFGDREKDQEQQRRQQQQAQSRNNRTRNGQQPTPARTRGNLSDAGKQPGQPDPRPNPRAERQPSNAAATKHPSRLEIYVKESKKPEGLVVDQISQNGAAWLAGIRRGDLIVSIGGLKTVNKDDVENITSVMKDGDQIEFEVVRRGKKEKLLVQFGDPPVSDEELEIAPQVDNRGASAGKSSRRHAVGRISDVVVSKEANNEGAQVAMRQMTPSSENTGLKSVLDRRLQVAGSQGATNADPRKPSRWQVQPPSANGVPRPSAGSSSRQVDRVRSQAQQPGLQPLPAQRQTTGELNRMRSELEQKQRQIELLEQKLRAAKTTSEEEKDELTTDSLLDFSK